MLMERLICDLDGVVYDFSKWQKDLLPMHLTFIRSFSSNLSFRLHCLVSDLHGRLLENSPTFFPTRRLERCRRDSDSFMDWSVARKS